MNPQHLLDLVRRLDNVRTHLTTLTQVAAEVSAIEAEIHAVTQQLGIGQQQYGIGGQYAQSPYGQQQYGMGGFGGGFGNIGGGGRRRRRGRGRGQGIGGQNQWQQSQQQAFPFTAPNMGGQGGNQQDIVRTISQQVTQQVLNTLRQQGAPFGQPHVGQS